MGFGFLIWNFKVVSRILRLVKWDLQRNVLKVVNNMFRDVANRNMNAVVVHVRPFGDAMYPSDIFP